MIRGSGDPRTVLAFTRSMTSPEAASDWRNRLLQSPTQIRDLLGRVRRIAVLGIKPESHAGQPAFYVPEYAKSAGFEIIPVPVYYPEVKEIMGEPVFRRLADVPGSIDMVNVFRRPQDLAPHFEDIVAARPGAVWLPAGIRDDAFAERLAREGIDVVQDRCLMVELSRMGM